MADERVKLIFEGVDQASKVAGLIDKRITAMSKKMGDISKRQANVEKLNKQRIDASVKADGARRDSWKKTIATGAVVVGTLVAVGAAAKKAFDLGKEGAAIKQTADSFDLLLEKVGAAPDLMEQLQKASKGTIKDFDLMTSTATLLAGAQGELATGLANASPQLLLIAKAANKLNPALGTTAQQYASIQTGIKRASPMILDNLGLTIRIGAANEKMAESLGKSVASLSAEEKQMALLNETMRAGNVLIEQVGGNVDSAADSYARLETASGNAFDRLKVGIDEAIGPMVSTLADGLEANNAIADSMDIVKDAVDRGVIPLERYKELWIATRAGAGLSVTALHELAEELDGKLSPAEEAAAQQAGALNDKLFRQQKLLGLIPKELEDVSEALKENAELQQLVNQGLLAHADNAAQAREANLLYALATEELTAAQRKALITEKEELDRLDELVSLRMDGNLSLEKYVGIVADGVVTEGELAGAIATTNVQFREEEEAAKAVRLELEKMDGKSFNTSLNIKISQSGQLPSNISKTLAVQAFAHGGRPTPGQAAVIGEEGAELFVPDRPGTIIPSNQLGGGSGGGFSEDQFIRLESIFLDMKRELREGIREGIEQVIN